MKKFLSILTTTCIFLFLPAFNSFATEYIEVTCHKIVCEDSAAHTIDSGISVILLPLLHQELPYVRISKGDTTYSYLSSIKDMWIDEITHILQYGTKNFVLDWVTVEGETPRLIRTDRATMMKCEYEILNYKDAIIK